MKEELKSLKEFTTEIIKEKKELKKQQTFFNMKVEEKNNELNIAEIFKFLDSSLNSYESAVLLNLYFPHIKDIVDSLRKAHPKYGEKRLKTLTINILLEYNEVAVELTNTTLLVDNYFLYESCGFFKVLELENKISELESKANEATNVIFDESKEKAIKVGNSIKDVVKPYGEIAKSQLHDAGEATKEVINKGSKKLIKVLQDLESKTNKEDK